MNSGGLNIGEASRNVGEAPEIARPEEELQNAAHNFLEGTYNRTGTDETMLNMGAAYANEIRSRDENNLARFNEILAGKMGGANAQAIMAKHKTDCLTWAIIQDETSGVLDVERNRAEDFYLHGEDTGRASAAMAITNGVLRFADKVADFTIENPKTAAAVLAGGIILFAWSPVLMMAAGLGGIGLYGYETVRGAMFAMNAKTPAERNAGLEGVGEGVIGMIAGGLLFKSGLARKVASRVAVELVKSGVAAPAKVSIAAKAGAVLGTSVNWATRIVGAIKEITNIPQAARAAVSVFVRAKIAAKDGQIGLRQFVGKESITESLLYNPREAAKFAFATRLMGRSLEVRILRADSLQETIVIFGALPGGAAAPVSKTPLFLKPIVWAINPIRFIKDMVAGVTRVWRGTKTATADFRGSFQSARNGTPKPPASPAPPPPAQPQASPPPGTPTAGGVQAAPPPAEPPPAGNGAPKSAPAGTNGNGVKVQAPETTTEPNLPAVAPASQPPKPPPAAPPPVEPPPVVPPPAGAPATGPGAAPATNGGIKRSFKVGGKSAPGRPRAKPRARKPVRR